MLLKRQLSIETTPGEGACRSVGRGGLADPEAEAVRRRAASARHVLGVVHGLLDGTLNRRPSGGEPRTRPGDGFGTVQSTKTWRDNRRDGQLMVSECEARIGRTTGEVSVNLTGKSAENRKDVFRVQK